jgi:hypothetical protein
MRTRAHLYRRPSRAVRPPKKPAAAKPPVLPAAVPPATARFRVLLIGNNYVGTANELSGCVADIQHAKQYFRGKVPAAAYYELSDAKVGGAVVHGPQGPGTRANILAGIEWLVGGARAGDRMYVHYSGHGGSLRTAEAGEVDRVDSTWVPLDYSKAGCIVDNDLRTKLAARVPAGAVLWVTSDSCHSGSVLDLRYAFVDASGRTAAGATAITTSALTENAYYAPTRGRVLLLSGCKDLQTSADAYEDNMAQGALSWALFSALGTHGSSGGLNGLLKQVRTLLAGHRYTQMPQLSSGQSQDLAESFTHLLAL